MYKVFKSYYSWHGDKTESDFDFIQIVECDRSAPNNFVYEGYYRVDPNENIHIYCSNINYKGSYINII